MSTRRLPGSEGAPRDSPRRRISRAVHGEAGGQPPRLSDGPRRAPRRAVPRDAPSPSLFLASKVTRAHRSLSRAARRYLLLLLLRPGSAVHTDTARQGTLSPQPRPTRCEAPPSFELPINSDRWPVGIRPGPREAPFILLPRHWALGLGAGTGAGGTRGHRGGARGRGLGPRRSRVSGVVERARLGTRGRESGGCNRWGRTQHYKGRSSSFRASTRAAPPRASAC